MSSKVISVQGLDKLRKALMDAANDTAKAAEEAVREEVKAIGEDVEKGAPEKTGELRRSIRREARGQEGSVAATARHATFVEHGTYKDRAQPYMQPAAERSRKRFPGRVSLLIKTALEGRRKR